MIELWYAIVALLFTAYVVLDGYDLGAGALHLWIARNDEERRAVFGAIGPFWDGNEVCLLVAGGALFVAFPAALAAGLSGFALAIFLVLWSLILRGISIEFRSHVGDPLWRTAWDVVFFLASGLLPVLLGAALANVVRGVPIDEHGWFELPLFTDFSAAAPVGVLDWFTILTGLFALVVLVAHGAAFLAFRAVGPVDSRARRVLPRLWLATALLWPIVTWAAFRVNPSLPDHLLARPLAWLATALALAGFVTVRVATQRRRDGLAFCGSCAFVGGVLAATASCLYPTLLRSLGGVGENGEEASILAMTSASPRAGLVTALVWFSVGAPLVATWFVIVHRLNRPKAPLAPEGAEH